MTNINIELFRRYQPRKKLELIEHLNEQELFMITTDTVKRIIKEAGVRRKGSRGSYDLSLRQINITGNRWNSDIEGWGIWKNRLYIDFYLQYDNTDTTTLEHIGNFLSPGEFLGELHATDRHDNPRTYYFRYDTEDKGRAIRALLRQYVENKYADKLKEEEDTV